MDVQGSNTAEGGLVKQSRQSGSLSEVDSSESVDTTLWGDAEDPDGSSAVETAPLGIGV